MARVRRKTKQDKADERKRARSRSRTNKVVNALMDVSIKDGIDNVRRIPADEWKRAVDQDAGSETETV